MEKKYRYELLLEEVDKAFEAVSLSVSVLKGYLDARESIYRRWPEEMEIARTLHLPFGIGSSIYFLGTNEDGSFFLTIDKVIAIDVHVDCTEEKFEIVSKTRRFNLEDVGVTAFTCLKDFDKRVEELTKKE